MPPAPDNGLDGGDLLKSIQYSDELGTKHALKNGSTHRSPKSAKANTESLPFLERLRQLPTIREIPWRNGQELPPEKAADSSRVQQRGAVLLATRGEERMLKCENCARGYGRFEKCVTMKEWFQGACSGCMFTSKGNKCSLRTETTDGRSLRYTTENPEAGLSYIRSKTAHGIEEDNSPKLAKKRQRKSVPAGATSANSHLDMMLQEEIARGEVLDEVDTIHVSHHAKRDKSHNHTASTPVYRTPYPPSTPNAAWGQSIQYQPSTAIANDAQPSSSKSRDAAPLSAPRHASASLLDAFPKGKQRQILLHVSGIEGGINHMTAQLASLKNMLGIPATEDETRQ